MGVQLPGTWQTVPPQPQLTSAAAAAAPQITQSVGGALPQAAGVVAYPMQQFQVSPQVSCPVNTAYAWYLACGIFSWQKTSGWHPAC